MADHFEEVVHLRLSALEARVDDEVAAVKEYFVEQQQYITHSLNTLAVKLRAEWQADLHAEIGGLRVQIDARFTQTDQRLSQLEQKFSYLDQKLDARDDAMRVLLGDILRRLPGQ